MKAMTVIELAKLYGMNRQSIYKRINKGRRIFPSETSLEKSLYLATEIITERWTAKYQNWGVILRELRIHYGDRIPSTITI